MTEMAWEKPAVGVQHKPKRGQQSGRLKFLIGGLLILGAIVYLIFSGTSLGARYFLTVDDVVGNPAYLGESVRLTGAVIGETIIYDSMNGELNFTIAHIPSEFDDLATALHEAANDPEATRLPVYLSDTMKPELLQHEAQAILTGTLGEDGIFYATELLLKCPSRFEEDTPGSMIHLQQQG